MKQYRSILALVALCAVALPLSSGADPGERLSTSADGQRINLTIYNGTTSLVHDRRRVELEAGVNRIAWQDVSQNIDATSALLADVTAPGGVRVVEQNFDFDLLTPSAMIDKYVGREVTVVHDKPVFGRPTHEQAKLLSDNSGLVLQYGDRVETGLYNSHLVFPAIPSNLRAHPTLILEVNAAKAGPQDLDLSYLTDGLNWRADYVGVVSPDETRMQINGLVTLANTTGATYANAHVQLVAGNVNVAVPQPLNAPRMMMNNVEAGAPRMQQENYFEYHLYTLDRPTTVADAETKQVALLSADNVPIRKTLELRDTDSTFPNQNNNDLGSKLTVGVYITFANKGGDLGVPLPGGVFRLYKNDSRGTSQFLGSDSIDHTPRDQDVRIHVGDSFDVTATKKQTDLVNSSTCTNQGSYQIAVANAKDQEQDVLVVESIPGVWSIVKENFSHQKPSSGTATWLLHIPARQTTTLEYAATTHYCG
jgi:hypothetical protein